jgi:hypothetical protein
MPSADEMSKHLTALTDSKLYDQPERIPDPTRPKQFIPDSVDLFKGLGTTYYKNYLSMSPQQAYATAKNTTEGNSLANKKNANFSEFTRGLNSAETSIIRIEAEKTATEISKRTGVPAANIDANHLWAYNMGLYNKKPGKDEVDDTEVKNAMIAFELLDKEARLKISKQLANAASSQTAQNADLVRMQKWATLTSSGNVVSLLENSAPDSEIMQLATEMKLDVPAFIEAVKKAKDSGGTPGYFDILNSLNKKTPKQ